MKHLSTITTATALALAISCSKVDLNNPLDPKGTDYLWGYDVTEEEEKEMISDGDDGSAKLWTDPNYACDMRDPDVSVIGDNPARITYDVSEGGTSESEMEFKRMMGLLDDYWYGVIQVSRGVRNTVVTVTITLSTESRLSEGYHQNVRTAIDRHDYMLEIPEPGTYYIMYEVEKPLCGDKTPYTRVERTVIIE